MDNLTYSREPKRKITETDRYIISLDSLRLIAYNLPKDHELCGEHTYYIHNFYYSIGEPTELMKETVEWLKEDKVISLIPGSYKIEKIQVKKV